MLKKWMSCIVQFFNARILARFTRKKKHCLSPQDVADQIVKYIDPLTLEFQEQINEIRDKLTPPVVQAIKDPKLYLYPKRNLRIRIAQTNDRDDLVINTSKPCWTDGSPNFTTYAPFTYIMDANELRQKVLNSDNIQKLLTGLMNVGIAKVQAVSCMNVVVTKSAALSWDQCFDAVLEQFCLLFPEVENEQDQPQVG